MTTTPTQQFVDAIEAIYASAAKPGLWPDALQRVADCFGDAGANLTYRRDDGSFGTIVSPGMVEAQRDYEEGEWWRQDIRAIRAAECSFRPGAGAMTDRDVASDEETESHPIYAGFLARHGLRWVAGVQISPDPHVSIVLSCQRRMDRPRYEEAELRTLERLGTHAEQALRLGIRITDALAERLALSEAMNKVGQGIHILDGLGRVIFSNPAAIEMLEDGLELTGDRLAPRFQADRKGFQEALRSVLDVQDGCPEPATKPVLVQRSRTGRPLIVHVMPVGMSASGFSEGVSTRAKALLLVTDPRPGAQLDPSIARDFLGLTLGEARVATLIGAGLAPRETSTRLSLTFSPTFSSYEGFPATSVPTTARSSTPGLCATGSRRWELKPPTSCQAAPGRTAIARASTPNCATSY